MLENAGGVPVRGEGEPERVGEGGVHAAYMEGKGRGTKGWASRRGEQAPLCPRLACGGVGAWVRWAWHIPDGEYVFAAMVPVGMGQGMLGGAAVVSWLEAGVGVDAHGWCYWWR